MVSNALSSRRGLIRRPKVCSPSLAHEDIVFCPSINECQWLNPAAKRYAFDMAGLSNGICDDCGSLNGTKIIDHRIACNWDTRVELTCFFGLDVSFSIGELDATLLLLLTGFLSVTYRGPIPTSLFTSAFLTKLGGNDFCEGFPSRMEVYPVCE